MEVPKAANKVAHNTHSVELLFKINAAPKFEYQSNDIIATLEDFRFSWVSTAGGRGSDRRRLPQRDNNP